MDRLAFKAPEFNTRAEIHFPHGVSLKLLKHLKSGKKLLRYESEGEGVLSQPSSQCQLF